MKTFSNPILMAATIAALTTTLGSCTEDGSAEGGSSTSDGTTGADEASSSGGESAADTTAGDGDGDGTGGDGDGTGGDGDGTGGDGDGTSGDGTSGDGTTGDGDSGNDTVVTGDGDGDGDWGSTGTGDGDGDGTFVTFIGDGDGTFTGDGDGWTSTGECMGDGDGDGDGDGTPPDPACQAPMVYSVCDTMNDDPFKAMGLNCSSDPTSAIPIFNDSFTAQDPLTWRSAASYGDALGCDGLPIWVPTEGDRMLLVSTGHLADPDVNGNITLPSGITQPGTGTNANIDGQTTLPGGIEVVDGSNMGAGGTPFMDCDGFGDCSDTLQTQWAIGNGEANDLVWFEFDVTVPAGVEGYRFDFAWFSSEFPEYVGSEFNDVVVWWAAGQSYTGNIAFIDQQPLTVTALAPYVQYGQTSPRLSGTGYENVGGATGWFRARGSAVGGETLHIAFALFDMTDSAYDTAMLLDNFRWECEGCMATNPEDCGVQGPS